MERIQRLKKGDSDLPDDRTVLQSEADAPAVDAAALQRPKKRRRVAKQPSDDSDSGDDMDEDAELDWRAKGL